MSKSHRAKIFKSGNSLAIRLPKALGIGEGEDMVVVPHADGSFTMYRVNDALDVLMSLPGRFSPGFMSEGRGDIEQPERDWSVGGDTARAA